MERIESLVVKFQHPLLEVQSRAASNLLFKLQKRIIDTNNLDNDTISLLFSGINKGICNIIENVSSNSYSSSIESILSIYLSIMKELFDLASVNTNITELKELLNNLYKLSAFEELHSSIKDRIFQLCETLCGIKKPIPHIHHPIQIERASNLSEHFNANKIIGNHSSSSKYLSVSKAGCILKSELALSGWKSGSYINCESDNRHLFDCEVKIKMAQKANIDILFDILCDFPSLSILKNNVNILEEVLNIIGSFDINNSIGNESDTGLLMTGRCSPVDCIHWCTLFVKRCIKSIHQLASGDLACAIPEYQLSESRTTSLAMQMAKAVLLMRHPKISLKLNEENGKNEYFERSSVPVDNGTTMVMDGVSVQGFAFSACAAALPLLEYRNIDSCYEILNLMRVCLPLLSFNQQESSDEDITISLGRWQHIISRIEQILKSYGDFPIVNVQSLTSLDNNQQSNSFESFGVDAVHMCVYDLLIEVSLHLPLDYICTNSHDTSDCTIKIGPAFLVGLKRIYINNNIMKLFEKRKIESMSKLINKLDKEFCGAISLMSDSLNSVDIISIGISQFSNTIKYTISESIVNAFSDILYHCQSSVAIIPLLLGQYESANDIQKHVTLILIAKVISSTIALCSVIQYLSNEIITVHESLCNEYHKLMEFLLTYTQSNKTSSSSQGTSSDNMIRYYTIRCIGIFVGAVECNDDIDLYIRENMTQTLSNFTFENSSLEHLQIQPSFLCSLVTPKYLQLFLLFGLLNNNYNVELLNNDTDNISMKNMISTSLSVVEMLLEVAVQDLLEVENRQFVDQWSTILIPLKLVAWTYSFDDDFSLYVGSSTTIEIFTSKLEAICSSDIQNEIGYSCYHKSLVMGMFHKNSQIRDLCYHKLQYEMKSNATNIKSVMNISSMDMPYDESNITMRSWDEIVRGKSTSLMSGNKSKSHVVSKNIKSKNDHNFTHLDIKKLADIICSAEYNIAMKNTAIQQLISLINSNNNLLLSYDINYSVELCRNIIMVIKNKLDEVLVIITNNGSNNRTINTNPALSSNNSISVTNQYEIEFIENCAYLLLCIQCIVVNVRDHFVFYSKSSVSKNHHEEEVEHSNIDAAIILKYALNLHNSNVNNLLLPFSKICFQILSIWSLAVNDTSTTGKTNNTLLPDCENAHYSYTVETNTNSDDSNASMKKYCLIPHFLWNQFNGVNVTYSAGSGISATVMKFDIKNYIAKCFIDCPMNTQLHNNNCIYELIQSNTKICCGNDTNMELIQSFILSNTNNLHNCSDSNAKYLYNTVLIKDKMAEMICGLLQSCKKHVDHVRAVHSILSLISVVPDITNNLLLSNSQNGIYECLSRIFEKMPVSKKDLLSFKMTVNLLYHILETMLTKMENNEMDVTNLHSSEINTILLSRLVEMCLKIHKAINLNLLGILIPIRSNEVSRIHANGIPDCKYSSDYVHAQRSCQTELLCLLSLTLKILSREKRHSGMIESEFLEASNYSKMCALLSGLVVNEFLSTNSRYLAGKCLLMLLEICQGNLCGIMNTKVSDIFYNDNRNTTSQVMYEWCGQYHSVYNADNLTQGGEMPIEMIAKCAKLLRSPDSMRCSSVTLVSLQIISLYGRYNRSIYPYKLESAEENLNNSEILCNDSVAMCNCCRCWRCEWLCRYFHDRRSSFRLAAIGIVRQNMKSYPKSFACMNLNNTNSPSHSDESSSRRIEDDMKYILMDNNECPAVRISALQTLLYISLESRQQTNETPFNTIPMLYNRLIIGSISDFISLSRFQNVCKTNIYFSVKCLLHVLTHDIMVQSEKDNILNLCKSLKIFPHLINILGSDYITILHKSTNLRVENCSIISCDCGNNDLDDMSTNEVNIDMDSSDDVSILNARILSIQCLLQLHSLNSTMFNEAAEFSFLIRNCYVLFTNTIVMSKIEYETSLDNKTDLVLSLTNKSVLRLNLIHSICDLFSVMSSEVSNKHHLDDDNEDTNLNEFNTETITFIYASIIDYLNVIQNTLLSFIELADNQKNQKPHLDSVSMRHFGNTITSMLRFMSIWITLSSRTRQSTALLENKWITGLELGGRYQGCECGHKAVLLFHILMKLQNILSRGLLPTNISDIDSSMLCSRISVTLSMMLQHSNGLREIIHKNTSDDVTSHDMSPDNYVAITISSQISNIVKCSNNESFIATLNQLPISKRESSSSSISANSSANVTCDISRDSLLNDGQKKALKLIKSKSSPTKSTSIDGKPSIWRDKVRSYSKTNITHSETSKQRNNNVSIVDAANMDVLRLDAWSSLLFISSAFQACDNIQCNNYLHSMKLHHALTKLMRSMSICTANYIIQNTNTHTNELWKPSLHHFVSSVITSITSISYMNVNNKFYFENNLSARLSNTSIVRKENAVRTPSKQGSSNEGANDVAAGFSHFLLSQCLSKGISSSLKYICGCLLESYMRDIGARIGAMRSTVLRIMLVALRDNLNSNLTSSSTHIQLDQNQVSILLHILGSCMVNSSSTPDNKLHSPDSIVNLHDNVSVTNSAVKSVSTELMQSICGNGAFVDQVISLPELSDWIENKYENNKLIITSLMCLLGRVGSVHSSLHGSRKLLANVSSMQSINLLVKYITENVSTALSASAIIALWSILSTSEQAIAVLRSSGIYFEPQSIKIDEHKFDSFTYATVSRAKYALQKLH